MVVIGKCLYLLCRVSVSAAIPIQAEMAMGQRPLYCIYECQLRLDLVGPFLSTSSLAD